MAVLSWANVPEHFEDLCANTVGVFYGHSTCFLVNRIRASHKTISFDAVESFQ